MKSKAGSYSLGFMGCVTKPEKKSPIFAKYYRSLGRDAGDAQSLTRWTVRMESQKSGPLILGAKSDASLIESTDFSALKSTNTPSSTERLSL